MMRPLLAYAVVASLAVPAPALARQQPAVGDPAAPAPVQATPAPAATPAAAPAAAPAAVPADAWQAASVAPAPVPAPAVAPGALPPPRPVAPPRRRNTEGNDLIAAGLSTFGTFYFFTSLAGAVIIDNARDRPIDAYTGERRGPNTRRVNYGRALLVPAAGPFIALAFTNSAKERWGAALSGSAQVTGAVLTMIGIVRKARARRAQRYEVGAGMAAGGAMLSVAGRF